MPNVMAALLNIGGALCESSVIPFLVPRRKLWLTPTDRVPCINAANIGERKTWRHKVNFAAGKIPLGGTAKHRAKSFVASGERRRCSNEAKTKPVEIYLGAANSRIDLSC